MTRLVATDVAPPGLPLSRAGLPPAEPKAGADLHAKWLRKGQIADAKRDRRLKLSVSATVVALLVWSAVALF